MLLNFEWLDEDVERAVQACVKSEIISPDCSDPSVAAALGCVEELLVAELLDWASAQKLPENEAAVRQILQRDFAPLLEELGAEAEEIDALALSVYVAAAELAEVEDDTEELAPGECELCEREAPITRHHVHPLMVHDWAARHLGKTQKELHSTIGICRPCHDAVHRFADHKTLAEHYSTREQLLETEYISKFVSWVRKQKVKGVRQR